MVIIAVVIVLALVVVGLVLSQTDKSQQISTAGNKLGLASQAIGITESLIDPSDGNFVVRLLNNSDDIITVSNVSVGDTDVSFSEDLAQGSNKFFRVDTSAVCVEGKVVSEDVTVTYVTRDGLSKTEKYPAKVMFDCSPYVVNATLLANQCPIVGLHSGQTTVYDSDGDDAINDGTVKSYTDNGDGTVTDNQTGLMWWKDHYPQSGSGFSTVEWIDAIDICEASTTGSHSDWRLPSFPEIATLFYGEHSWSPLLHPIFTQEGFSSSYLGLWSSTTPPLYSSAAYVFFYDDAWMYLSLTTGVKTNSSNYGVRCVRSGS